MTAVIEEVAGKFILPIPKEFADAAGMKAGDKVTLKSSDGMLTVERIAIRRIPLKELIQNIKPEQLHGEIDWGPPVGNEVW